MLENGTRVVYNGSLREYAGEEFAVIQVDPEHAARHPEDYPDGFAYTLESGSDGICLRQVRNTSFTVLPQ